MVQMEELGAYTNKLHLSRNRYTDKPLSSKAPKNMYNKDSLLFINLQKLTHLTPDSTGEGLHYLHLWSLIGSCTIPYTKKAGKYLEPI